METNRAFGYAFGGVYALVGLVGFAITSGVGFAATQGKNLIIFELNPLHNIVHLLVAGLLLYGASKGLKMSRNVNMLVGVVYLATGVLGLLLVGSLQEQNILAINHPDNALHFATAALALGVAVMADKSPAKVTSR